MKLRVFLSFEEAESSWREIEAGGDLHVFQTFEWLSTWQRLVGVRQSLDPCLVLEMDSEGVSLMLLPLVIEKKWGLRHLVWLATSTANYRGPLFANDCENRLEPSGFWPLWRKIVKALPPFDLLLLYPLLVMSERHPCRIGKLNCILSMDYHPVPLTTTRRPWGSSWQAIKSIGTSTIHV